MKSKMCGKFPQVNATRFASLSVTPQSRRVIRLPNRDISIFCFGLRTEWMDVLFLPQLYIGIHMGHGSHFQAFLCVWYNEHSLFTWKAGTTKSIA